MKINKLLGVIFVLFAMPVMASQFNQKQVKDIQVIVHNYLVKHPEVLVEASHALQQQKKAAEISNAQKLMIKYQDRLFNAKGYPMAGNLKGKIVLVEFFDYQCPHCHVMGPMVDDLVKNNKNLKVVFRSLPAFGPDSLHSAQAALAAISQQKYLTFHRALLKHGYPLSEGTIFSIAKKSDLNLSELKKDMNSKVVAKLLKGSEDLAGDLQLDGVPVFYIVNLSKHKYQYVSGQVDEQALLDAIDKVS
ncbi:MAG: DsbA family protein [Gammaproteobacteria bacterium]|nr:DsbA family protein [Gammaproteobacteria bacterium]